MSDFEAAAQGVLSRNALTYVSSSANSALSLQANLASWSRIRFRPRVLRDVQHVSPQTSIFGHASPYPFYPSAMGQLGRCHPGAEAELVRAIARRGAHALISAESTLPLEDIAAALKDEQQKPPLLPPPSSQTAAFPPSQLHYQLYVHTSRAITTARIRRARAAGYRSLWITVDTPVLGKRTADRRLQAASALDAGLPAATAAQAGLGRRTHAPQGHLSPSVSWADLAWIQAEWGADRPVVLKGVQSAEDARLALQHGCRGVALSNHGGRQAHSAPDALTTLLEIREYAPEVLLAGLEVFVDGGAGMARMC